MEMGLESVENWVKRLSPSSERVNRHNLGKWLGWMKENGDKFKDYTPDQLIEYQRNASNSERYNLLDCIQSFIVSIEGRIGYKERLYSTIRSYFMHNRSELPRDGSFNIRAEKPRVVGTLTIEELRDIILSCNSVYQAAFTCMFQGGMGLDELCEWNEKGWEALKESLRDDPNIIKINLSGRKKLKNIHPFYTFIGRDAIDRIKAYLPHRPRDAEAIFIGNTGKPISKKGIHGYWMRHLKKLGKIKQKGSSTANRYGKNPHELRDLFRTQWEKSPAKISVAEYCLGHVVDPLEYNKAYRDHTWTKNEYLKAVPMLNIMSSDRPFGKVDQDEVIQLRRELEEAKAGRTSEMGVMRAEIEELRNERKRDDALLDLLLEAAKEDPDLIDRLLRRKAQIT